MRRKKGIKNIKRKSDNSTTKIMFLSIILLFIILEALYIIKGQIEVAHNNYPQQVAGVRTSK